MYKPYNQIQYYREFYGLSQRELAEKVGISKSMLSYIESGKKIPNVYIALDLATALNTTVEELFEGDKRCKQK